MCALSNVRYARCMVYVILLNLQTNAIDKDFFVHVLRSYSIITALDFSSTSYRVYLNMFKINKKISFLGTD